MQLSCLHPQKFFRRFRYLCIYKISRKELIKLCDIKLQFLARLNIGKANFPLIFSDQKTDKTRQLSLLRIVVTRWYRPIFSVQPATVAMLSEAAMNINLFTLLPCRYVTKRTGSLKCDTTVFFKSS